jgi:hypothetical protein
MIVSKDINPERDFYFLGGKIIELVAENKSNEFDFFDLFEKINEKEKLSINLFTLTLDWLYLIGAIDKTKNGNLIKCF